jgi:hypothetical protein
VGVVDGTSFRGAALLHPAKHAAEATTKATSAAEELGEQVFGGHASTSSALQAGLTILVICGALLGVRQDFVGGRDLLELVFGSRVVGILVCNGGY